MAREDIPLDLLDQKILWRDGKKRGKKGKKREEEGERSYTFSLEFPAIEPSVSIGVRGKVLPRD